MWPRQARWRTCTGSGQDGLGRACQFPLRERIADRRASFLGRHLHATIDWQGDHVFLSFRPRDARDLLTRRETSVALAFAEGRSYREVAALLDLAPATVRHHLRAAYLKLDVKDKAALATTLASPVARVAKPHRH